MARVITPTSSSYVGARKKTDSLITSPSTLVTSSSSEVVQAKNTLSVRSEEAAERAFGSGIRAEELEGDA